MGKIIKIVLIFLFILSFGCSSVDSAKTEKIKEDKVTEEKATEVKEAENVVEETEVKEAEEVETKEEVVEEKVEEVKKARNISITIKNMSGEILEADVTLKSLDGSETYVKSGNEVLFENLEGDLYSVTAYKDGYNSKTIYYEVEDEDVSDLILLMKKPKYLTVIPTLNNEPIKAQVALYKNGKRISSAAGDFIDFKVQDGIYQVKASGPFIIGTSKYVLIDGEDTEIEVEVREGTIVHVNVYNEEKEPINGIVEIKKDGILVDDLQGTEVKTKKLPRGGMYAVTAKKDGYLSTTKYIFTNAKVIEKKMVLRKPKVTLKVSPTVNGEVEEAKVEITKNGKVVAEKEGKDVNFKLTEGIYKVKVYGDKYLATSKYIAIKDSDTSLNVPLTRVSNIAVSVFDAEEKPLDSEIEVKSNNKVVRYDAGEKTKFIGLKNGVYEVVIKNDLYKSISKFVYVNNEDVDLKLNLIHKVEEEE